MSKGRTRPRRALLIGLTVAGLLAIAAAAAIVVGIRSLLPDEDAAARNAQASADAIAPHTVHVDGAEWSGEAGGYGISAHLVDDPDAFLRWHAARDGRCDRGQECRTLIPEQIATSRAELAEERAVHRGFTACGLSGRTGDTRARTGPTGLEDSVVVRLPLTDLRGVLAALDTCARALPAARTGLPEEHRIVVSVTLLDEHHLPLAATAAVLTDGALTTSTADTLVPATGPDSPGSARVTAAVTEWLVRRGTPPTAPLTTDAGDGARFLPGRADRIRHYVPLPRQPDDATGGPGQTVAVAVTTDPDGARASDLRIVPVLAGVAQDPLAPPPRCLPWRPTLCSG